MNSLNADLFNREGQIEALKADVVKRAGQNQELINDIASRDQEIQSLHDEIDSFALTEQAYKDRIAELQDIYIQSFTSASAGTLAELDQKDNIRVIRRFTIRDKDNPKVHREPDFSSPVIGHARASTEYEVLAVNPAGWYCIRIDDGKTGWIFNTLGTLKVLEFGFEQGAGE